jgi:hypothetical protein
LEKNKFADKNATRNDVKVGGDFSYFKNIKFQLFKYPNHFNISELEKPYYQGEILVYEFIPIEFILNINELKSL